MFNYTFQKLCVKMSYTEMLWGMPQIQYLNSKTTYYFNYIYCTLKYTPFIHKLCYWNSRRETVRDLKIKILKLILYSYLSLALDC